MKRFNLETAVGLFVVAGFVCFAWLSIRLGDVELFGPETYQVKARFGSISGLKEGGRVEIAGVDIGRVLGIRLDPENFDAVVTLAIRQEVRLSEDSIASIRTAGIIGDRYVEISPGGLEEFIQPGGRITETESAINIEQLISKYIFESK